jgi:hypothetical protein
MLLLLLQRKEFRMLVVTTRPKEGMVDDDDDDGRRRPRRGSCPQMYTREAGERLLTPTSSSSRGLAGAGTSRSIRRTSRSRETTACPDHSYMCVWADKEPGMWGLDRSQVFLPLRRHGLSDRRPAGSVDASQPYPCQRDKGVEMHQHTGLHGGRTGMRFFTAYVFLRDDKTTTIMGVVGRPVRSDDDNAWNQG